MIPGPCMVGDLGKIGGLSAQSAQQDALHRNQHRRDMGFGPPGTTLRLQWGFCVILTGCLSSRPGSEPWYNLQPPLSSALPTDIGAVPQGV